MQNINRESTFLLYSTQKYSREYDDLAALSGSCIVHMYLAASDEVGPPDRLETLADGIDIAEEGDMAVGALYDGLAVQVDCVPIEFQSGRLCGGFGVQMWG